MNSDTSIKNTLPSYEGQHIQPTDEKELRETINRAFDYRGDVTIQLKTGEQVTGYVFDRDENASHPYVKIFLPNYREPKIVLYQQIAGVMFSGDDMAFGRSWESWAQKWKKPESRS